MSAYIKSASERAAKLMIAEKAIEEALALMEAEWAAKALPIKSAAGLDYMDARAPLAAAYGAVSDAYLAIVNELTGGVQ